MRCYLVTATKNDETVAKRLAPTNAAAREVREELMEQCNVKKKDVSIEDHDVPVAKPDLLAYLNDLLQKSDVNTDAADE